jgi:hypothetical protein
MSSPVWPTPTSSQPFGMARHAVLWSTSLVVNSRKPPRCCSTLGGKKGQKRHLGRLASVTNNGNVEVEDSNEECVVIAEHDFKRCTRPPKDHFEKILEAACPHHPYPVKHKLRDCTMMKKFMSSGAPLAAMSQQETQEVGAWWMLQPSLCG